MALAQRTLDLVNIASVSGNEAEAFAYVDACVPLETAFSDGESAIYAKRSGKPLVLLAGHTDTVPAQGNLPGRIEDGAVVGLGATDMKGGLAVMIELGRWAAHAEPALRAAGASVVVPVPLHWRRLWARRFNQSAALAQAISRATAIPVTHTALRRVKATAQQVGLSRAERATNVQGAFRAEHRAKAEIAGRRLIVIDDVLTSGATSDACARALLRAGAAQVDVLVFARVVDGGKAPI
jgi:hypothetical protein